MEIHGGPRTRKRRKPADPNWINFMSDDEKELERITHWQSVSLTEVGLSVRIINSLGNRGIMTVGDLTKQTADELRQIQNLGEITIKKCTKLLDELQLPNRMREDDDNKSNIGSNTNHYGSQTKI